MTVTEAS